MGNYDQDFQESMQRFAALLYEELRNAQHEVKVIRPAVVFGSLNLGRLTTKWLGYIDKFVIFPFTLHNAAKWADLVHICDHSNAWYVNFIARKPHVITCHDLLAIRSALGEVPENKTGWTGRQLQRMVLHGLSRSGSIACDSDATLNDVRRLVATTGKNIQRVYIGLNYDYRPMADPESASRLTGLGIDPSQPFVLHVGGNQWYKNRLVFLRFSPN